MRRENAVRKCDAESRIVASVDSAFKRECCLARRSAGDRVQLGRLPVLAGRAEPLARRRCDAGRGGGHVSIRRLGARQPRAVPLLDDERDCVPGARRDGGLGVRRVVGHVARHAVRAESQRGLRRRKDALWPRRDPRGGDRRWSRAHRPRGSPGPTPPRPYRSPSWSRRRTKRCRRRRRWGGRRASTAPVAPPMGTSHATCASTPARPSAATRGAPRS